jgi:hypothetical protein
MPWDCAPGHERWLLIRRSRRDPDARAYYLVFAAAETSLAERAGAAGLRWTIEACFQHAKDDLRPRSLRVPVLAWLAAPHDALHGRRRLSGEACGAYPRRRKQTERQESGDNPRRLSTPNAVRPSAAGFRCLIARRLPRPPTGAPFILAWSAWRRWHQTIAAKAHRKRQSHYKTQL